MGAVANLETGIKCGIFMEKYEHLSISDKFIDNDPTLTTYSNEIY